MRRNEYSRKWNESLLNFEMKKKDLLKIQKKEKERKQTYTEQVHAHSQVRASPAPRFVLEAAAHAYGFSERQQVVRLAINVERCTRHRLLDDADPDVATHLRHFHTFDHEILVNKPKHNRTLLSRSPTRRAASAARERVYGTTCWTRSISH